MSRRGKSGGRRLSAEEQALWDRVAASAAPMHSERRSRKVAEPVEPSRAPDGVAETPSPKGMTAVGGLKTSQAVSRTVPEKPRNKPNALPLSGLDRRTEQRLRRGRIAVDGTLDLHGMTQARAHSALRGFLQAAQMRGDTNVLVITGKGAPEGVRYDSESMFGAGRGILKRLVPEWLSQPDMRILVSGFRDAHQRHGGGGALYVRIRKSRR